MFEKHFSETYTRALVLWTWWGNDIVSALIVALDLQRQGIQTDVAWVLSPGAIHYFAGKPEKSINAISWNVQRYINGKSLYPITFVDGVLPKIADAHDIQIPHYYDFSTRFGTQALSHDLQKLVQQRAYDLFVEVDVGGDILARGVEDLTLLSPLMDFTSLHLMRNLSIDNYLVEFWLLTDGELRPQWTKEILHWLQTTWLLLDQDMLSLQDPHVQSFINVFDDIKKIRAGHTWVMTLKTLEHIWSQEDILTQYRFRSQVGSQRWHTPFDVVLPHEYFGQAYLIDGKWLAQQRTQTAFAYENPLEQYIRLKSLQPSWKTEMDLFYLRSGDNRTTAKQQWHCLHCLMPSTMIDNDTRKKIIEAWIGQLASRDVDVSLILKEDLALVEDKAVVCEEVWNFALLYKHHMQDFAHQVKHQIQSYQQV